jgi:hypothetical protein
MCFKKQHKAAGSSGAARAKAMEGRRATNVRPKKIKSSTNHNQEKV